MPIASHETFLTPSRVVAAAGIMEGMKVADFGCGSGFFARAAARAVGVHGEVWAIDADRPMLARLATLARLEGIESQMRVLPGNLERRGGSGLPDASLDFVIAANLFFSAHHKPSLAAEIARVLKVSPRADAPALAGRAIIIDWSDSFGGIGPAAENVVSVEEIYALLVDAGLEYVQTIPAGSHHWGFVVRKK